MSTLFNERTPFDLLFRNLFKADGSFQEVLFENKQPHPLDIYYDDKGLHFEVACKGLASRSFNLGYKVAAKFELESLTAEMKDGLLHILIPISESKKPKTIKIK